MGDRAHDAARRMHARTMEMLPAMHAQVSPTAPPDVHPASLVSTLTAAILHAVAEEQERVAMGRTPEQSAGIRIISGLLDAIDACDEDDCVDNDLLRVDLVRLWDAFAPGTRALDEGEMRDAGHRNEDGDWFTDYTCDDCGTVTRFDTQSDNHCPACRGAERAGPSDVPRSLMVGERWHVSEQTAGSADVWPQSDSDASGIDFTGDPRSFRTFELAVDWCKEEIDGL